MLKIAVIGLGYVGLPISLIISKNFKTIGYDINKKRILKLKNHIDVNNEFKKKDFKNKRLNFTFKPTDLKNCNFFIVCVPTPIKKNNKPDLNYVEKSFKLISTIIKKEDIVVLESTVYPGVTNKYSKLIEKKSGLKKNKDFYVCYSPERINPGDKKNSLTKINKIVAYEGNNTVIKKKLFNVYSKLSKKIIYTDKIKEAETAKAIENIQRDLNISFFNEILLICSKLNLNFNEVVKLAKSKWNFLEFSPGLVGGHCLPVDPYYLTYVAKKYNYASKVTLSGRYTNNYMKNYVLQFVKKKINNNCMKKQKIKICVLGLTYKYGVADTRNSQKIEIYNNLKKKYKNTTGYDPFLKENNYFSKLKIKNSNFFLFLTKGEIYKKIFEKLNKNQVIDPFLYYLNK